MPGHVSATGPSSERASEAAVRTVSPNEVRAHLPVLRAIRDRGEYKFVLHATTRVDALISLLLESDLPGDASVQSFALSALQPAEAETAVIDARCALRYARSNVFGFLARESAALAVLLSVAEAWLAAASERVPDWRPAPTIAVPGISKRAIGFHPERAELFLHDLPHDSEVAMPVEAFAHILRVARETPLTPEGHLAALAEDMEHALAFADGPAELLAERLHVSRPFPPEQVEAVEQLGELTHLYIDALSKHAPTS